MADGKLDEWVGGVHDLATLFSNHDAQRYFAEGKVSEVDRVKLLDRALPNVEPRVRNLGRLLISKGRTGLAPAIAEELQNLANEHNGIVKAQVTTAVELDSDGRRSMQQRLEKLTGKKVEMETRVDESIIGGMIARIGDRVIDGSTRARLVQLKKQLAGQPR